MRDFEAPGRSLVMAANGMAATSHPLATLTAVNVLQAGGNAMDAAVAACAVQCVVEPGSTGIGGDCFALYAPGGGSDIIAFNGSGRTPAAARLDWYHAQGFADIPRRSPHAVTVPGAVDAWSQLVADHGTRTLSELLKPAIGLAEEGYAIGPRVHFDWSLQVDVLKADPTARRLFLIDGKAPPVGARHRQPELAATLRRIAAHGRDAFYQGAVADDIVGYLHSLGGLHSLDDFKAAAGRYVAPIGTEFRGHEVHECPPNGQGLIALLLLNILSGYAPEGDPLGVERLHREIEAARLGYAVRDALLCDMDAQAVPVDQLLSRGFADALRAEIRPDRIIDPLPAFPAHEHRDTVYIAVVDKERNAASFINSLFDNFGSGLVAPSSGVLLHDRGIGFALEPGHPNAIAPSKRPLHTIIPGLVTKVGKTVMSFGVMGGDFQAMGHAQFLSKVLDYGLDLQAAIDLPRVFPLPGTATLEAEARLPPATRAALAELGYRFARGERPIGGAQAVWIDWRNNVLIGASDPRKDGCALGY